MFAQTANPNFVSGIGKSTARDFEQFEKQRAMADAQCANSAQPERATEIPALVGGLNYKLQTIGEQVARLQDRLMPVLRSMPPTGEAQKEPIAATALGGAMIDLLMKADRILGALESITSAVEL